MKKTQYAFILAAVLACVSMPFIQGATSTANRAVVEQTGTYILRPIAASTHIYAGQLVSINSAGNVIAAANTASTTVLGVAQDEQDNSTGAIGDKSVRIKRGVFRFANSVADPVTKTSVGGPCYVEDDHTVAITTTNTIVAGMILAVDTDGVWVDTRYSLPVVGSVADGAVTADKIGTGAVTTAKILDATILPEDIATDSITTAKILAANVTPVKYNIVEARTVTASGATTGTISDTTTHVTVTSDSADKILILPTPTPGRVVWIHTGATGFELRSSAPATVAINAGTGVDAESAIAANSTVLAICVTATAWKAIYLDADSDVAKVEAAAP